MNIFNLFKRNCSASVARNRLQILFAYERTTRSSSDLLVILREEILATIGRHVEIDPNRINVRLDRGDNVSIIEVDVEIPNTIRAPASGNRRKRMTFPLERLHERGL